MKLFADSFVRDKHISLYTKLMIYFPIIYILGSIAKISEDPYHWDIIVSSFICGTIFILFIISRFFKNRIQIKNKIVESTVIVMTFIIPINLIILGYLYSQNPTFDVTFRVIIFYASIFVASITLYSEGLLLLFYLEGFLLSFIIPFILNKNFQPMTNNMDVLLLHPIIIFCVSAIQFFGLKYFKINILNQLMREKERADRAVEIQKEMSSFYENLSTQGIDGIIALNHNMNVSYINKYVIDNEYSRNAVIGQPFDSIFTYFELQESDRVLMTLKIKQTPFNKDKTEYMSCRYGDGFIHVFITPLFSAEDNSTYSGCVINTRKYQGVLDNTKGETNGKEH